MDEGESLRLERAGVHADLSPSEGDIVTRLFLGERLSAEAKAEART